MLVVFFFVADLPASEENNMSQFMSDCGDEPRGLKQQCRFNSDVQLLGGILWVKILSGSA